MQILHSVSLLTGFFNCIVLLKLSQKKPVESWAYFLRTGYFFFNGLLDWLGHTIETLLNQQHMLLQD